MFNQSHIRAETQAASEDDAILGVTGLLPDGTVIVVHQVKQVEGVER
jgi:hypothetical protein